jgi:hypothetical protein
MPTGGKVVHYVAAGTVVAAGILHVLLFTSVIETAYYPALFFLTAGAVQIFWAIPMIRRWGIGWYYAGIGGTAVLIMLWAVTRVPNPITGVGLPINEMGIAVEALQVTYIVVTSSILATTLKLQPREKERAA